MDNMPPTITRANDTQVDGRTECPKQTESKDDERTSDRTIFQKLEAFWKWSVKRSLTDDDLIRIGN
jgi:hypothetical protein